MRHGGVFSKKYRFARFVQVLGISSLPLEQSVVQKQLLRGGPTSSRSHISYTFSNRTALPPSINCFCASVRVFISVTIFTGSSYAMSKQ